MAVAQSDIDAIRAWAVSYSIVRRVWVFGSRVRGTERPDSDLDVAVEHDALAGDSDASTTWIYKAQDWRDELGRSLSVRLDLQPYIPGQSSTLQAGLDESSYVVYERTA